MKYSKRLAILLEDLGDFDDIFSTVIAHHLPGDKGGGKPQSSSSSTNSGSSNPNNFEQGEAKANGKWSALWDKVPDEKILQILIIYFVLRYSIIHSENSFKKVINDPSLSKEVLEEGLTIKYPISLTEKFSIIKVQLKSISYEDFKALYGGEGTELASLINKTDFKADGSYDQWWDNTFEPITQEIINPKKN